MDKHQKSDLTATMKHLDRKAAERQRDQEYADALRAKFGEKATDAKD